MYGTSYDLTPVDIPAVVSVRVREIMPSDLDGCHRPVDGGVLAVTREAIGPGSSNGLPSIKLPQGFPRYGYMLENDGTPGRRDSPDLHCARR